MKKYLIAVTMLVTLVGPASAYDRRHHQNPPARKHHHHHQRHNNIAPWIAGGLALGALGGLYYYNNRRCWDEPLVDRFGHQVYDQYGRPLARRFCD
jgi:hypothetical protein